jgi:hypothetical protein
MKQFDFNFWLGYEQLKLQGVPILFINGHQGEERHHEQQRFNGQH